ncbi:UbiX family flavin prenyltransferase [Salibacterium aidingense]|uniref:UbiX family flavin prenyltransferase n=1 Tax=Salibacterium aidingense TaxID=384933 RepID=UPI003BE1609C
MDIIIGMSGASGSIYGVRILEILKNMGITTHLVMSHAAGMTIREETNYQVQEVMDAADYVYKPKEVGAAIASGSFKVDGMVIIPCSIKTLSAVANSYNDNLLTRAADVQLKENRKLVMVVRETPLHTGHLQLMTQAANIGAVVLPPVPSFYHQPQTIDDIIHHTIGKVLDQFGIDAGLFQRWGGLLNTQEQEEKNDQV